MDLNIFGFQFVVIVENQIEFLATKNLFNLVSESCDMSLIVITGSSSTFFAPTLELAIFQVVLVLLSRKWYFKTTIWVLRALIASRLVIVFRPLYTYSQEIIYLHMYV